MGTKHLNVTRKEAVKVIVDYEVNKFSAYLVLVSGSPIVFAQSYDWKGIRDREEFTKYKVGWGLPIECSRNALAARTHQL